MKQFNSNKTGISRFDKIPVIHSVAEVYGESNERQLCSGRLVFIAGYILK